MIPARLTAPSTATKNETITPSDALSRLNAKHFVLFGLVAIVAVILGLGINQAGDAQDEAAGKNTSAAAKTATPPAFVKVTPDERIPNAQVRAAAAMIDQLVLDDLSRHKLQANAPIDDPVFVRRVYLALAGRIPSVKEIEVFHANAANSKRADLIDQLLASPAYVSHQFNWWADKLRMVENMRTASSAYQLWLKRALRQNKPYDQMVYELIAADGFIWDDGAAGYYVRDRGMPLDNTSNTVRLFMGTRLECAQCHDHPFDDWTQRDYYRMAAFTWNRSALQPPRPNVGKLGAYTRQQTQTAIEKATGFRMPGHTVDYWRKLKQTRPRVFAKHVQAFGGTEETLYEKAEIASRVFREMNAHGKDVNVTVRKLYDVKWISVDQRGKPLTLPHDYQYDDAAPQSVVTPKTMFKSAITGKDSRATAVSDYAKWLTSPENPRFTKVIANRMWKQAFGMGLVEPLDNFDKHTRSFNPQLFEYLTGLMREVNYDLRTFQRILYNTQAWQRAADARDLPLGSPYHFPGPLLQRMSAEQIWDSFVNLAINNADNYHPREEIQQRAVDAERKRFETLEDAPFEAFAKAVTEVNRLRVDYERKKSVLINKGGPDRKLVRRKLASLGRDYHQAAMASSPLAKQIFDRSDVAAAPTPGMHRKLSQLGQPNGDYAKLVRGMARASDLPQPARPGHFLRNYGQSDREVIQNASRDSSVPQALQMLNGTMLEVVTHSQSKLGRRLASSTDHAEKLNLIFQTFLSRKPDDSERAAIAPVFTEYGDDAYRILIWSLINSKSFIFIQ
jgi:hypothetical protein